MTLHERVCAALTHDRPVRVGRWTARRNGRTFEVRRLEPDTWRTRRYGTHTRQPLVSTHDTAHEAATALLHQWRNDE